MEVQVEPTLLKLVSAVEKDFPKAVSEALALWLKENVPTGPITVFTTFAECWLRCGNCGRLTEHHMIDHSQERTYQCRECGDKREIP